MTGRDHSDGDDPARGGPLVLIADRDADTRCLYAEFLGAFGYAIDEADDGREALAKAVARRPTVVVTETRLPGLGGLELCRALRREPALGAISIIVVTGDPFSVRGNLAEAAGADAVLIKPCLPQELLDEIARVMARAAASRCVTGGRPAGHDSAGAARHMRDPALGHGHERSDRIQGTASAPGS